MVELEIDQRVRDLALGCVEVSQTCIGPSGDPLAGYCAEAARRAVDSGMSGGEQRRTAVRQLLRYGGFKPSGRSKPAQEYLLRSAVQEGALPAISNVVDLINAVSLESGLPISLVSLERVGRRIAVRYGEAGESYEFNRAGQQLDVAGLLCLCAAGDGTTHPVGSPVKDSLAAKVDESDRNLLACVYAPRSAVAADELRGWCDKLAEGFHAWCGAAACDVAIFHSGAASTL